MKLGDRIREYRKQAGLTQKQLGEKLGVSNVNIGQYERGLRNPKLPQLKRIADALDIPFDLLVSDKVNELVDAGKEIDPGVLDIFTQTEFEEKLAHIHYSLMFDNAAFTCYTADNQSFPITKEEIRLIDRQVDQYLKFLLSELMQRKAGESASGGE
jgi:transcriptional regulator with XRE-family HTH domain